MTHTHTAIKQLINILQVNGFGKRNQNEQILCSCSWQQQQKREGKNNNEETIDYCKWLNFFIIICLTINLMCFNDFFSVFF